MDGSIFFHEGQRKAGVSVATETEVIWAQFLPSGASAHRELSGSGRMVARTEMAVSCKATYLLVSFVSQIVTSSYWR